jgi:hypothetical protein
MKKKTIEHEIESSRDELAEALADSINKNSDGKVAFFLDAEDDPSQITDWVSTGNSLVDLTIANRPNGGLPVGRITELTGLEALWALTCLPRPRRRVDWQYSSIQKLPYLRIF